MSRPRAFSIAILGIIASAGTPVEARAQDSPGDSKEAGADWQLPDTRKGFCIELLLDPAKLREVPDGVRLLPADTYKDLHPVLRRVVTEQPEYKELEPLLALLLLSHPHRRRLQDNRRREEPGQGASPRHLDRGGAP